LIEPLARALKVTPLFLESGGGDDRVQEWSDTSPEDTVQSAAAAIDRALLQSAIELALRSLINPYGLNVSTRRIEQAAEAAIAAYRSFNRLQRE
jgi:hypothetical protein